MPGVVTQTDVINEPSTSSESTNPYTITEDDLVKKLSQPNNGRYITQLIETLIAVSLSSLSFGMHLGWSNPVQIGDNYNITDYGWVAGLMPLGCSAGIIPWSISIYKWGPRYSMIIQTPLQLLTAFIMITIKEENIFLAGKFFYGFFTIALLIGGECLLLNSIHQKNVPHMLTIFRSSVILGILLSFIIIVFWNQLYLTVCCAVLTILSGISLFIIPESPFFLYFKSELKAIKALEWIRGKENTKYPLGQIKKDYEAFKSMKEISRFIFYTKVVLKGVSIIFGLTFFQVFSGYYAFIFYNLIYWSWVDVGANMFRNSLYFLIGAYISSIIGQIILYYTNFGVRKPILISAFFVSVSLTILTFNLYLKSGETKFHKLFTWLSLFGLNLYVISYELALGNFTEMLIYDYLPFQTYSRAKTFIGISYWLETFLLLKYFIAIKKSTNFITILGILTIISYFGILYAYIFIIETKDKTFIQIQLEIGGNPVGRRGCYRNRHNILPMPMHQLSLN